MYILQNHHRSLFLFANQIGSREDHPHAHFLCSSFLESGVEIKDVRNCKDTVEDRARITLSNGDSFTADFAVLAIGVQAQECCREFESQFYAR
jgi:thioredoxin reductase